MSGSRIADKLNELGIPTPMEYKQMNGENFQSNFRRKSNPKWMANGVNHILKNEVYTGVLLQGKTVSPSYKVRKRNKKDKGEWIRCENCHEPIISKEDFRLVKDVFATDTRVAPDEKALYLFSGFVKCGNCGGNMTRKTIPVNGKKYVYLVCIENKNKNGCDNNKGISLKKLEKIVRKEINLHIEKVFELSRMLDLIQKIPYSGYLSEKILDTYFELKEAIQGEIVTLEDEIRALKVEAEILAEGMNEKVRWVERFIEYHGFEELSRELLLRLVDEIRVYGKERVEIRFKFQSEYEEILKYASMQSVGRAGQQCVRKKGFLGIFNRDGWQRMISDIKAGRINCIIVKDFSRIGRNYIEVGN